ncbi:MAG: cyclic nucleotide-binding domain-containing protein, partial [Opitutae bacterium]|nr:cyclic nucleotide-binding domain-containing protein [Opitutae bacterium]
VFTAIIWAVSIHTVTAFLYVGLGGRPFWNSAIVGPRFLASAFAAGPALIILALQVIRRASASTSAREAAALRAASIAAARRRAATLDDLALLARHLPEIAGLTPDQRTKGLAGATVFDVATGEILLKQGDHDYHAFFVLSGRVVVKREESDRFRITRSVVPGGQFGEISALNHTPRMATAIAEEPTRVLCLPAAALRALLANKKLEAVVHSRMSERLMITDKALLTLRGIVQVAMIINLFLLFCEVFKEFYSGTTHGASAHYLFLGLHGHHALVPWIWTAIALNVVATFLLILPLSRSLRWLDVACVLAIVGIWIEKGMGLVIPGFIPTPLGAVVDYLPSLNETLVCLGIWAFGLLCYTVFLRMAVPILQGRLARANEGRPEIQGEEPDTPVAAPAPAHH